MIFSTRNFDPLTPLTPKFQNVAIHILLFRLKHTVAIVTHAHVLQNFYTTWVRGVACQKQRLGPQLERAGLGEHRKNLGLYVFLQPLKLATSNLVHNLGLRLAYQKHLVPKLEGVWAEGASKKCRTPYVFLQPLKLATSNLVHKLGLGLAYQKTTFITKIGGVWVRGASKRNSDPIRIFATVEANNFKSGTQIGFRTSLPKTTFRTKIGGGLGYVSIPKKFGTPYLFMQPLKLATSNFYTTCVWH